MDRILTLRASKNEIGWNAGIELRAFIKSTHHVILPVIAKAADEGTCIEPFMRLNVDEAQNLIDTLWDCGLRPSEGTGSAGAFAATQAHLSDMRIITNAALIKCGLKELALLEHKIKRGA